MSDNKYSNIFQYYRRDKNAKGSDLLEDNATKALINVLEHINNYQLCPNRQYCIQRFLNRLCNPNITGLKKPLEFHLQKEKLDKHLTQNKKGLLLIRHHMDKTPLPSLYGVTAKNSRLDALIIGQDFALGCESKIFCKIDKKQLKGHLSKIQVKNPNSTKNIKTVTWKTVYEEIGRITNSCSQPAKNALCAFLVRQFSEFLEAYSLAGFKGLNKEDFLFSENENEEASNRLRFTALTLAKEVYNQVEPIIGLKSAPKPMGFTRKKKDRSMPFIEFPVKERKNRISISQILQFHRTKDDEHGLEVYVCVQGEALHRMQILFKNAMPELRRIFGSMNPIDYIDLYLFPPYNSLCSFTLKTLNKNPEYINELEKVLNNNVNKTSLTFAISRFFGDNEVEKDGTSIVTKIVDAMSDLDRFIQLVKRRT